MGDDGIVTPSILPLTAETVENFTKPELFVIIQKLQGQIAQLQEQVARLSKNSSTSSKPPSSDIVKPPKTKGSGKPGGRNGHKGFWRKFFKPEEIDEIKEHRLSECPDCKTPLTGKDQTAPWVHQVVEIPEKLTHVTEHRRCGYDCPKCHKLSYAALPAGVEPGELFGPRLRGLVGYLKGSMHASYTTLQEFMEEVLKLKVSRAMLCDQIRSISESLLQPYQELEKVIAGQSYCHIDETGHKDNGDRYWIWVFCAKRFGFFTVDASRGSQVLKRVLGETFKGTVISDFFSAYVKYASASQQFCLAHFIRDVKFLTTLPDIINQQFGNRLLRQFKRLFYFWHFRHTMPRERYDQAIAAILKKLRALASEKQLPRKSQNVATRLDKHWSSYLRFLADPLIEPTNNLAEQTVRAVVIDRRITQGTRSEWGRR